MSRINFVCYQLQSYNKVGKYQHNYSSLINSFMDLEFNESQLLLEICAKLKVI